MKPNPLKPTFVLCILDGWGEAEEPALTGSNAIATAHTPHWDKLRRVAPFCTLDASGDAVGLPRGQMGNSEVGHMTLGAGRRIPQELPRITEALNGDYLVHADSFQGFVNYLEKTGGTAHLMGLISPGGVHAHLDHIPPLVRALDAAGIPVVLHGWLDGRDTLPRSAAPYLEALNGLPFRWGTLSGRYYAMDRDQKWSRTERAYDAMVGGAGPTFPTPFSALEAAYATGITDEFVVPAVLGGYSGMRAGDGFLCFNFRADRVRQILTRLVASPLRLMGLGMSPYADALDAHLFTLFPKAFHTDFLGEILSQNHLTQARIAETEKYAHVTFFLNGGHEELLPGEDRVLIPSPPVATYDLAPAMASAEVATAVVERVGHLDAVVVNFANPDMVGHTGNFEATCAAVEAVDQALGRMMHAVEQAQGMLLVTADHGNAECMRDKGTEGPHTAHTTARVPCLLYAPGRRVRLLKVSQPTLADIAPTVLTLLHLPIPAAMTGRPLFEEGVP